MECMSNDLTVRMLKADDLHHHLKVFYLNVKCAVLPYSH